jgi:hypothetical protein
MSETWAVVDETGAAHEVAVDEGRGSTRSWWAATPDVARRSHASARDAVVLVAQACEWAVVEVLAPGVETRAAEVAHLEARRGALLAEIDRLTARDRVTWGAMPTADEVKAHARRGGLWATRDPHLPDELVTLDVRKGRVVFRRPSGKAWCALVIASGQWRPVDADGCALPEGAQ